ncbi:branched-chain amino acid ABC transporter permease [Antribacter sp. KLBMP9083]|uniref:Branched-chain amino acid ABC transporter permease n=1 Tax=Antribacter soli TaxID=2910976 RepID=A0AA41QDY1_9MICO|nr:branched-chain amino acid ABC transporter permease [Antribacter soli]MCF4120357.1 branched-chain amino acid ABC transporter permease [Antribacter soli]
MTADRPTRAPAGRRLLAVLAAALATLVAPAALALAPAAADVAPPCTPDDQTACVAMIVLDADNAFVPGVSGTITGADFEVDVTSTADGPVSVAVPSVGGYTVAIDPATVPEGMSPDVTERQVTAQSGSTARAAFRIAVGAASTPSASASESDDASSPAATGAAGDAGAPLGAEGGDVSAKGVSFGQFWQQFGSGIRFGLLLALASVGISLIYGTTGMSSFSHGEQVTLGAVLGFLSINVWNVPIVLAVPLVLALCAGTGWLQDKMLWGPLRKRGTPVMQLMIVTIGLSMAMQYAIQMVPQIGGRSVRVLPQNPVPLKLLGITLSTASWMAMAVAVVVILFIAWFLTRTRIGRATRAVSDNPALAAATGINPDTIIRIVWIMSTGFAGLAGMLIGMSFGSFNWALGLQLLLLMFAAVTLGGLGTAFGALAGSIIIGLVVELSNLVMPSDLRYASALVILILVLLVRPQGLLGRRERIG